MLTVTTTGLLPLLKSIHKPCNLKKFSGQTIGVDAYGWLHRGTAACAIDLALDKPTTKYVGAGRHGCTGSLADMRPDMSTSA
jgi:hypothetical protein